MYSVICLEDCELYDLSRKTYNYICRGVGQKKRNDNKAILKTVAILQHMPDRVLNILLDALTEETYEAGTFMYRQGEPSDDFFLIHDGTIELVDTKIDVDENGKTVTTETVCYCPY